MPDPHQADDRSEPFQPLPDASNNRRGGLIGWGVLLIVAGVLAGLGALGALAYHVGMLETFLANSPAGQAERPLTVPTSDLVGMVALAGAAALTFWTGLASCQARRWARPVAMIGAVGVGALGLLQALGVLLMVPTTLETISDQALNHHRSDLPTAGSVLTLLMLRTGIILAVGVALPWAVYRFYADARTADLLARLDPRRTWVDRQPVGALGWVALVGLLGGSALVNVLLRPSVPAFVTVLHGAEGIVAGSVVAIGLLWAAGAMALRRERLAWVVSFTLVLLLRASAVTYVATSGSLTDLTGPPAPAPPTFGIRATAARLPLTPPWHAGTLLAFEGVATLMFGLYVSRYFGDRDHNAPSRGDAVG